MADHRKKRIRSWGGGLRWDRNGWRFWGNFPPPSRHVRMVIRALLVLFLLALIARLAGLELSAMLALIKPVIAMLS